MGKGYVMDSAVCALFDMGFVTRTPAVMVALFRSNVTEHSLVERHQCGDFGDVTEARCALNRQAAVSGGEVVSAYRLSHEASVVQVVTSADRSTTHLRLLSEAPQDSAR